MDYKQIFSEKNFNSVGLIFNIVGSSLIFISIIENPNTYVQLKSGEKMYSTLYRPEIAIIGLFLLLLGFVIMFVANQYKK